MKYKWKSRAPPEIIYFKCGEFEHFKEKCSNKWVLLRSNPLVTTNPTRFVWGDLCLELWEFLSFGLK